MLLSYTKKHAAPDVIDIVNKDRSITESSCGLVDETLFRYNTAVINSDERIEESSFINDDVLDDKNTENKGVESLNQCDIINYGITGSLLLQNDEEINECIQSFNVKQRQMFVYVLTWEKI